MDYDDNDCGGQNLHLAGEENSKISSVLQPFSLPKFDFDDSIHGHLRFDSLVENEVFLGIPSQEDNHWIEDFSRGSSGIEFSSNATESCALPRHDNVWSEATSSESVEMLLKAVGQEEVAPGETMVEGSDPQLGSSTKQVEVNLENDQMDYMLEGEGCSLKVTSENLRTDLKSSMDNQGDSSGLPNESLSKHEHENLPAPGTGVDNNESSSQVITESIVETGNVDKFCNPNFLNTISSAKDISVGVEAQKEERSTSYELVGGNDAEDISLDIPSHLEIPSKLESADHAVDVHVTTIGGTSVVSGKEESVSTFEGFNEASFVAEGDSDGGPAVFSSGIKITQLPEGCDMLTEKPSPPLQGKDFVVGIGIEDSQRDGLGDSADSSFIGVGSLERTVIGDITNVKEVAAIQEENLGHGDHVPVTLQHGSIQTWRENDLSVQSDVHECKLDASKHEKNDKNLPLDSMILVCDDNEKEGRFTFSGEVVEVNLKAASSQSNNSTGDNPVLDSEVSGTTMISSGVIRVADCDERGPPSYDTQNRDQIKFEANKESIISGTKVSFGVADEFAPAIRSEIDTLSDSAPVKEAKIVDQSSILMEAFSAASCDKASKDLNENMEHSAPGLTVQDGIAEAAPSEKPKEAEEGRSTGEISSIVSATIDAVDTDKSNQLSMPDISRSELSQGKVSKRVSLKNSDAKNVGDVLSSSLDAKVNLSKDEGISASDIRQLGSQIKATGDSSNELQPFPSIQPSKLPVTMNVSPPTSGGTDPAIFKEIAHETSLMSDGVPPSGSFKGSTERKSRRGSSKSVKESAKKGNQMKEKSPLRQTERGDKSCGPLSPLLAGQLMTLESVVKPRATVSVIGSSLPDLNTSAPLSAFFQQPFTDLQQVQLRAQIFVYGSLIQGVAPDEACMVSAFGVSDGGRSIWESSWRAVVEKLNGQKSQGFNFDTPVRSSSGAKAPDQVNRQTFAGSDVLSSPAGRVSNKVISSQSVNPLIPLSSPLWNISVSTCEAVPSSSAARCAGFDYPAVSPLHPYHTPPIRNLVSHTTSWQTQASFPVPWATSSQSSPFDINSNYTVFPISEPVKSTAAVKGLSSVSSVTKHISPIPAIHTGSTALFPEAASIDLKKVASSTTQTSANKKSRKRKKSSGVDVVLQASVTATPTDSFSMPVMDNRLSKKASAIEDFSRISIPDSMPMPVATSSHYSTSIAFTTPSSSVPKGKSIPFVSAAWPSISSDHLKSADTSLDKRVPVLEEFGKVEEAKLHAEEAAVHAAAAMRHCQGLWSQLEQQKNSGLKTEAEAKLAAAAVAVAAAASVAKAAAAAAKVASNAAMQAKQIADESVTKCGTLSAPECNTLNSVNNLANAIPVSILKGGDYNNTSSFVISAAKEAARKRVEAASAATRHAENLDAIVKAAEMAAEAVSHAGKVVAMGDPLTLSQLVEAGPDGYWKVSQAASVPGSKSIDVNNNKSDNSNVAEMYAKDMHVTSHMPAQRELSRIIVDTGITVEEGLVSSIKHGEKNSKVLKDKRVTESDKASVIAAEPFVKSRSKSFTPITYDSTAIIKEGSIIEVLKDHGDLKKAWFLANVLSLKDQDAFVCFTELQSDQGSEQLKEWVSLEAKDGNPPMVRIPHHMNAVQLEGTRKRRRAAVKDYTWSVGDKVDAWVQDCWREGIISEKNKKDTTTWSVHFPAQGETLDVKVWHLRPTVIWVDGQWIEWCRSGQDRTSQGDTPIEKRPKLGGTEIETKGKGELSKAIDFTEVDKAEHRLPLSAEETAFNVGSSRDGKKPDMGRTMRSGLQKEGSRVVIGVPKPGKKRKFIEVSKHYVSDRSTKTVPDDSVKLAKFLTSQGPGSRGSKNNSKIDLKEKLVAEAKSKALKYGKPPTIPSRILPRKDGLSSSHSSDAALSIDDNEPVEKSLAEFESFSNIPESTIVFSSRAQPENRKKTSAMNAMSERLKKGKLAPCSGKLEKNEADESFVSGVSEPRRSIRRIQPTSRLLEGLQSSLTISKLPSSSNDKSHRSHIKSSSKGYSSRN